MSILTISHFAQEVNRDIDSPLTSKFLKIKDGFKEAMTSLENDLKDDEKYLREFKDAIEDLRQKEDQFIESRLKCGQCLEKICELYLLRREDNDDPDVYGIDKITSLLQTFSIVNREMTNAMGNLFKVFEDSIKAHVDDICKDLTRKNALEYLRFGFLIVYGTYHFQNFTISPNLDLKRHTKHTTRSSMKLERKRREIFPRDMDPSEEYPGSLEIKRSLNI